MIAYRQLFRYHHGMKDDETLDMLDRIARGAVAITTRALASGADGIDLTFPQWRVLVILGDEPDGVRLGEIARRVGVTLPATSRLLSRLSRRGVVSFATDAADRRATRASLTPRGREVREAILAYRRDALRGVAAAIAVSSHAAPDTPLGDDAADWLLDALATEFDRFA